MNFIRLLTIIFVSACTVLTAAAQGIKKNITIKVVNGSTGTPVENATVMLQERSTTITKNTNETGMAFFEWRLTTDEAVLTLQVKDNSFFALSPLKTTIKITKEQDSYLITAPLRSGEIRLDIKALDGKTNMPLPNTTVQVMLANISGTRGTTGANGNVALDFIPPSEIRQLVLKATCDGYWPTEQVVDVNLKTSYYQVTISLNPNEKSRFLNVMVIDEKKLPVVDAVVTASAFPEIYKGTTDGGGMARILMKRGGQFNISIRHNNFETVLISTYLEWAPDQTDYAMDFQLKRKKSILRNLLVIVREEENGKPIEKARIDAAGNFGLTDGNGEAYLKNVIPLGETAEINIQATGYEEKNVKYIGGGDTYRYAPPIEDKVYVRLKKEKKPLRLIVIVMDKSADAPIGRVNVSIKNKDGKFIMSNKSTNAKGMVAMELPPSEWGNTPFRVMANAKGYSEQWSSLTADFLNPENNPMYFTIYLEQTKGATGEKRYGPFDVDVLHWVPTGVPIKKGQQFRVTYDTSSKIHFIREGTGETVYMYPDGFGVWGFFVLAAKVGDEIIHVGRAGGGSFHKDGFIELGAPRGTTFVPGDGKGTSGAWSIYVFVMDGVEIKDAKVNQAVNTKLKNANNDLDFLKQLSTGAQALNKYPEQVSQEVKRIIYQYNLSLAGSVEQLEQFILTVKHYQEYFYNRVGQPTKEELDIYFPNLNILINELAILIDKKTL